MTHPKKSSSTHPARDAEKRPLMEASSCTDITYRPFCQTSLPSQKYIEFVKLLKEVQRNIRSGKFRGRPELIEATFTKVTALLLQIFHSHYEANALVEARRLRTKTKGRMFVVWKSRFRRST